MSDCKGLSKELSASREALIQLKDFMEKGVKSFALGDMDLKDWNKWLREFDKMGGADWERRCRMYAEENDLLLDETIVFDKE